MGLAWGWAVMACKWRAPGGPEWRMLGVVIQSCTLIIFEVLPASRYLSRTWSSAKDEGNALARSHKESGSNAYAQRLSRVTDIQTLSAVKGIKAVALRA